MTSTCKRGEAQKLPSPVIIGINSSHEFQREQNADNEIKKNDPPSVLRERRQEKHAYCDKVKRQETIAKPMREAAITQVQFL